MPRDLAAVKRKAALVLTTRSLQEAAEAAEIGTWDRLNRTGLLMPSNCSETSYRESSGMGLSTYSPVRDADRWPLPNWVLN